MTWADSRVFTQAILNPMTRAINAGTAPTGFTSLTADALKAALYNNSITPDRNAVLAQTGYNSASSQWLTANEVIDTGGSNWVAGGRAMGTLAYAAGTGVVSFTAANTSGGGNVTIASAFGCLVYDSSITAGTVANQGMCYNYFGGTQSVTAGTFTIVWDATGVFKFTN